MRLDIGGQNPLWDGPVAAAALATQGHDVTFGLHTLDHFSRDPGRKSTSPALTQEALRPDGSYNRWTACLEHPGFLGRCAILPAAFERAGVNFDRIATFLGTTRDEAVADFTRSDWHGVSLGEDQRIAHGMCTPPMRRAVKQLAARVFDDLREANVQNYRLQDFEDLFVFNPAATAQNPGPHGGRPWHDVGTDIASRLLAAFGGERVHVTTTYDLATNRSRPYSNVFAAFVHNYREARVLYNEALADTVETVVPLAEDELPFYVIVKAEDGLHRMPIKMPGSMAEWDPETILKNAAREAASKGREVVAICGKAITFMLELRERGATATVQLGSPYLPAARRFAASAAKDLRGFPAIDGGYYVHLNALDALAEVEGTLRLPAYLARAFGAEHIACKDFAASWRQHADKAEARAERLSGADVTALLPALEEAGLLRGVPIELLGPIFATHAKYNELLGTIFGTSKRKSRVTNEQREQCARLKAEADTAYRAEFLNGLQRQALAGLDLLRAQALRDAFGVAQALRYWNCRPFALWVASFEGWMEAITRRTKCVPE